MLSRPNDILAIEYLKALRRQKAPMEPLAVLRQGAGHDGAPSGRHGLRLLSADAAALRPYRRGSLLPPCSCGAGAAGGNWRWDRPRRTSPIANGLFWPASAAAGGGLPPYDGGKEGLYHRFYQAVRTSCSPEALLETAKTKRYPTSRLRRMLLSAWLDVTPPTDGIPYLRVLAANERGRDLLPQMQRRAHRY